MQLLPENGTLKNRTHAQKFSLMHDYKKIINNFE